MHGVKEKKMCDEEGSTSQRKKNEPYANSHTENGWFSGAGRLIVVKLSLILCLCQNGYLLAPLRTRCYICKSHHSKLRSLVASKSTYREIPYSFSPLSRINAHIDNDFEQR